MPEMTEEEVAKYRDMIIALAMTGQLEFWVAKIDGQEVVCGGQIMRTGESRWDARPLVVLYTKTIHGMVELDADETKMEWRDLDHPVDS